MSQFGHEQPESYEVTEKYRFCLPEAPGSLIPGPDTWFSLKVHSPEGAQANSVSPYLTSV